MWITDFEYAGKRLSEFDCVVVAFNASSGFETKSAPTRQFNKVRNNGSFVSTLTSSEYKDDYKFTIQIGRSPCDSERKIFTVEEARRLIRWLDRKQHYKFKLVESTGEYHDALYYGTFNTSIIMDGDDIVGLSSAFESNAPYGFGEEEKTITSLDSSVEGDSFTLLDSSDDYGHHYFKCNITIMEDCDFEMHNSLDPDNVMIIKNCYAGEVIRIDGEHKTIFSTYDHPKLYNDFNYSYPRLIRTENTNENRFTANATCKIRIFFSPARKVMVL